MLGLEIAIRDVSDSEKMSIDWEINAFARLSMEIACYSWAVNIIEFLHVSYNFSQPANFYFYFIIPVYFCSPMMPDVHETAFTYYNKKYSAIP